VKWCPKSRVYSEIDDTSDMSIVQCLAKWHSKSLILTTVLTQKGLLALCQKEAIQSGSRSGLLQGSRTFCMGLAMCKPTSVSADGVKHPCIADSQQLEHVRQLSIEVTIIA
jgi:hypothetical protein